MASPDIRHLLPLCTSCVSAGISLLQYPIFFSFLHSRPSIAGRPLSGFWDVFIRQGGGLVVASCLTSAVSASLARRSLQGSAAASWYGYGVLCTLGHFAFVPLVMGPIQKMSAGKPSEKYDKALDKPFNWDLEQKIEETNRNQQAIWLWWHTIRTILVDFPAVWCFARGLSAVSAS